MQTEPHASRIAQNSLPASPWTHRLVLGLLAVGFWAPALGQSSTGSSGHSLANVTVFGQRTANPSPAGTFAMPVSQLRYEPLVDLQGRNLAEAQADVAIRGGTFENTGFSLGALPVYDPQTGHYFAELPLSPRMLTAAHVRTGAAQAMAGFNATAGSIAHDWQSIRSGGAATLSAGDFDTTQTGLYIAGKDLALDIGPRALAADASFDHSTSDGSQPGGGHQFTRYSGRLQLQSERSQTDIVVGHQTKRFSWLNLYTPFNTLETEDLKTQLYLVNHRLVLGANGDFLQFGASHRRHRDIYRIPAFDFLNHHRSEVTTGAIEGRISRSARLAFRYRAGLVADRIDSNALVVGPENGRFDRRIQSYAGLFADYQRVEGGPRFWMTTVGVNLDHSNRASTAFSPTLQLVRHRPGSVIGRWHVSFSQTTQLPTYTALNSNNRGGLFAGNRDLGRAKAQSIEWGAQAELAGWLVQSAMFVRRDRSLVDWTFSFDRPNQRTANPVDIDNMGLELVAGRALDRLELVIGYTWLGKTEDYRNVRVDASFYALNYPRHRMTAAIIARLAESVEVRIDNDLRVQADNVLRTSSRNAFSSALGIYFLPPAIPGLSLSLQVDNLTNNGFQAVPRVPASRRLASLGVRYGW